MANPFQFMQQVRAETSKVVWPTRKETMLTTAMVFLMSTVAAIFFFMSDLAIQALRDLILATAG